MCVEAFHSRVSKELRVSKVMEIEGLEVYSYPPVYDEREMKG